MALIDTLPQESWVVDWYNSWPLVESPDAFIIFAGYAILGAVLGRSCWIDHDHRKLYPMLNTLFIGPSGIGKTTALELGVRELLGSLPPTERPAVIEGGGTPEKIHEDLAARPHTIVYAEELAAFFNKQDYNAGLIPYFCLPPDTRVLMADLRWLPLGEVKVGDEIVGFDEESPRSVGGRYLRRASVLATGRKRLPCYKIATDKGELVASEGHGFLCRSYWGQCHVGHEWLTTEELSRGHEVRYFGKPWDTDNSGDARYLEGILDGEGNVARYCVALAQNRGKVLEKARRILEEKGFRPREYSKDTTRENCRILRVDPQYDRLRLLGSIRPERLLDNCSKTWEGHSITGKRSEWATVENVEYLGLREVVPLQTTTGTLISDGYFSHNTELLNYKPLVERRTKGSSIVVVREPEVVVLGASTKEWLQKQLPDAASAGGFLARFLVVAEEHKRQRVALPAQAMTKLQRLELGHFRARMMNTFAGLTRAISGPVDWQDYEASDEYSLWYNTYQPASGHLAPFAARAGEFVQRLALLTAISRNQPYIATADVHAGIELYKYATQRLQSVVVPYSRDGELLAKVLECIGTATVDVVSLRRQMRNYCGAKEVDRLAESLI